MISTQKINIKYVKKTIQALDLSFKKTPTF